MRFIGTFREEDRAPYDPMLVECLVEQGGITKRLATQRLELGRYAADITLDAIGILIVRFESRLPTEQAFAEKRYLVEREVARVDAAPRVPAPKAPPKPDAVAIYLAEKRGALIRELRTAGVMVDESRSDAYLEGIRDELARRR
jgi:hypothetical protein